MVIAWLVMLACGPSDPCTSGSMLDGPGGLELTEEEHPSGWGQGECFACHAAAVTHRTGCTPGVDLAAVREQVDEEGASSCAVCHGDNGVEP